jgi:hypothetical protein
MAHSNDSLSRVGRGRKRPNVFRALGSQEPPERVTVDGNAYYLREIFKHDSWAATAKYGDGGPITPRCPEDRRGIDQNVIVCKFNRQSPVGLIPMRWLGRWLAYREHYFLSALSDVCGIPEVYDDIRVDGKVAQNAVAHAFVPGSPLSLCSDLDPLFFERIEGLVAELHRRRIVYVDLHKQENVIVGDDGLPYLIDFQVSLYLPNRFWLNPLFRILQDCDRYHLYKHRKHLRIPGDSVDRPWLIRAHRRIGVPLRTARRRFLVLIGVRRDQGNPSTEIAPEVGLRRAG